MQEMENGNAVNTPEVNYLPFFAWCLADGTTLEPRNCMVGIERSTKRDAL